MRPRPRRALLWTSIALLVATSGLVRSATAQTEIEPAFPNLTFSSVTDIQAPPDGTNRLFVLERSGSVVVFENDPSTSQKTVFLDISNQVDSQGEGGILGLAFHPSYEQNGEVFIYYTTSQNGPFRSVVSRFTVSSADPDQADPSSEQVVLTVDQPYSNHNAGQLQFGPGGYLYVGLGDGGSGGDPEENGQDPTTLLGSMLRLDVDLDGSGGTPDCGSGSYEIPSTNPFVSDADAKCDEIYAYGFRNPYRYSFGPDGRLWVADVGQNDWEEIDWVEAGNNYGWDVMEGNHCYEPSTNCDSTGLELPVYEYGHDVGNSITGGYVYEGSCSPLQDQYIYGDYGSGRIWGLSYDASGAVSNDLLIDSALSLTTFGTGPDDGLYFAGIFDDALYQFVCTTIPVELAAFTGRINGTSVTLRWQTASETNNAGFRVQRKRKQEHNQTTAWTTIGFVEGMGTTTKPQSYDFVDEELPPSADTLSYRLKQIDTDGTASYSETRTVALGPPNQTALHAPVPNPTRGSVTLRYHLPTETEVAIRLFDVMGRKVATLRRGAEEAGRKQVQVSTSRLSPGAYFVRMQVGTTVQTQRLTVVK